MAIQDHPMWRRPLHHLDHEDPHDHVHWIELFYDLIHVVIIFMLGNYLTANLDSHGFLVFSGLFIVIWFGWADSGAFNSFYVSTDVWHRVIMAAQIVTAMFMAAAVPAIESYGAVWFIVFYAINRAITALMYYRAKRNDSSSYKESLSRVLARNFGVMAVLCLAFAFLPDPWNLWGFIIFVILAQLHWVLPKIGVIHMARAVPRLGHMNERFALLMLIVLGEGFFKLVVTLTEKGIYKVGPEILVNFTFGGFAIFILAWIYFDFVGNGKVKDTKAATLVLNWFGHLFLMLSGVAIGVALSGEVKVGFWEPYDTKYAALGCFGLAAYIALLGFLQSATAHRVAHKFARWDVKIFGIALAIASFFIVSHVPSIVGNALWGTALLSQILVPLTRGYLTLKDE